MENKMTSDGQTDDRRPQQHRAMSLHYGIDDNPPWYICILLAFQVCTHPAAVRSTAMNMSVCLLRHVSQRVGLIVTPDVCLSVYVCLSVIPRPTAYHD